MSRFLLAIALIATALRTSEAQEFFNHNGSTMLVEQNGSTVSIFYAQPRSGIRNVGVQPGTLPFEGQLKAGYLEGMSRMFSRRCGEIDYFVYGDFQAGARFVLSGAAPVLGKNTCQIVDNVYDGPNATLVFTPLSTANAPQPASATKSGNACITNIRPGSTLNVRVGPSTSYGVIAEIPAGSCDVEIGETCLGSWCGIRHNTHVGWVNTNYLNRR
ncbi:MAG: SH3 domain-containing protein [Pseudomonadota bacterium]